MYDKALPRPGRELVRGEVLPSAWVLQPDTRHRKEVTKVVYMTQVQYTPGGLSLFPLKEQVESGLTHLECLRRVKILKAIPYRHSVVEEH